MSSKIVELNELNPGLEIKSIDDNDFRKYGKRVEG